MVQPGNWRGMLELRGSVLSPIRCKAKGNFPLPTPPTFCTGAPPHVRAEHSRAAAPRPGTTRAIGGPGVGNRQPPSPRRPIGPAHSHRRAPRRAGRPRRRDRWRRPNGAGSSRPSCSRAGRSVLARTDAREEPCATPRLPPRVPGALRVASRNTPSWAPWWNRHPRSSPEEAEGPAARREEHENNCSHSLHDVSEANQISFFHPAGSPRETFPAAAASSLAQEGFQALALEGGRRDHTRS